MSMIDTSSLKSDTVDTFHGVKIADPFRIMEDSKNPAVKSWVAAQNKRVEEFLSPEKKFIDEIVAYLSRQMDYQRSSLPAHYGDSWFRSYNPGLNPQPVQQIARAPQGPWETFLDPLQIDPKGVTSIANFAPREDGKLVAYTLSVAGDDECTLFIRDTATGKNLPDVLEKCRFLSLLWDVDGNGFHYSYPVAQIASMGQQNAKNFVIRYHRLGTDFANDPVTFFYDHPESFIDISRHRESGMEIMSVGVSSDKHQGCWVRAAGAKDFTLIVKPQIESLSVVAAIGDDIYAVSDKGAPRMQLVKFKAATPDVRTVIVPEEKVDVLDGAFLRNGKFFLNYSHDAADQIRICLPDGTSVGEIPLPIQSVIGFGRDVQDDTGCYVRISSYQTPGTTYYYDYVTGALEFFTKSEAPETLEDCIVERKHAPSKDGTLVPMTIIRAPDTKLDGTAALCLYGYGGFNVPLTPAFSALRTLPWIRQGGIFVVANLRGGGEFGTDWYDAGRLLNKQNVFDDFHACAEWLIANKYTTNKRLVSEGGSNGGLLTAATMLQRPDLYGAVISQVPVTDMFRYDLSTYGAYWKSDYGDPKVNADDFKATMGYAPLHNIKAGIAYPPHLVMTADTDTRVDPMHAWKFSATMQDMADESVQSFLRTEIDAGHAAGTSLQKSITQSAEVMGFCQRVLGPISQKAYVAQKAA